MFGYDLTPSCFLVVLAYHWLFQMFGCLVYEITSGTPPHNEGFADKLQLALKIRDEGLHPSIPDNAPELLKEVMKACFRFEAGKRPSFGELMKMFNSNKKKKVTAIQDNQSELSDQPAGESGPTLTYTGFGGGSNQSAIPTSPTGKGTEEGLQVELLGDNSSQQTEEPADQSSQSDQSGQISNE